MLPGAIHDFQNLLGGFRFVEPSGLKLSAADSLTEGDDRLIDDHRFAVHRRMPRLYAMTKKDRLLRKIHQIVETDVLRNRRRQLEGSLIITFDIALGNLRLIAEICGFGRRHGDRMSGSQGRIKL